MERYVLHLRGCEFERPDSRLWQAAFRGGPKIQALVCTYLLPCWPRCWCKRVSEDVTKVPDQLALD